MQHVSLDPPLSDYQGKIGSKCNIFTPGALAAPSVGVPLLQVCSLATKKRTEKSQSCLNSMICIDIRTVRPLIERT